MSNINGVFTPNKHESLDRLMQRKNDQVKREEHDNESQSCASVERGLDYDYVPTYLRN